jgi:hypothetical protein
VQYTKARAREIVNSLLIVVIFAALLAQRTVIGFSLTKPFLDARLVEEVHAPIELRGEVTLDKILKADGARFICIVAIDCNLRRKVHEHNLRLEIPACFWEIASFG